MGPEIVRRWLSRLRQRDARLQPAEGGEKPGVGLAETGLQAAAEGLGAQRNRHVEPAADVDAEERLRSHADDLVGKTVKLQRAADGRGTRGVLAMPERIAQHHGRRCTPADVVGGREYAPGLRFHAERIEELAVDPHALDRSRFSALREIERGAAPGGHAGKDLLLAADAFEERVRQPRTTADEASGPALVVGVDGNFHELVRIGHRQGAQTDRVHQLEDRRVGASAEGERGDGDGGKQRVPA